MTLTCPICKGQFSKIDKQHLKKHNLSKEEYFEKFGENAPFGYSPELKQKKSGENHPGFGKPRSEEIKQKVSNGVKKMWEETGGTEAQRNALGKFSKSSKENGTHFNTGKTHIRTPEYCENLSKSLTEYYEKNPKEKFSEERLLEWHSTTKYKIKDTKQEKLILLYKEKISNWAEYIQWGDDGTIIVKCNSCQNKINVQRQTVRKHIYGPTLCHTCYPIFKGSSKLEDEIISEILKIHNIPIIRHDKQLLKTLELDIVIPEFKLAIEVDGLYWHSDKAGYDSSKHILKTEMCENIGYQLIHIFESEWILKREIVLSRLCSLLNKSSRIFARKCKIAKLSQKEKQNFFNLNHLQGDTNSSICYGLIYNNEIVAAMSFGKPRFSKKYDFELIRYASKLNTSVIGGASKLFEHFKREFPNKSIISYADRRWSIGNLYKNLGFTQLKSSSPAYWYFKKIELYHRVNFQKHKLKEKLEHFDNSLTEWENMQNNGWNRIWDCGNLVFELK